MLDLRGAALAALPTSMAVLPNLWKLDLRWTHRSLHAPFVNELTKRASVERGI